MTIAREQLLKLSEQTDQASIEQELKYLTNNGFSLYFSKEQHITLTDQDSDLSINIDFSTNQMLNKINPRKAKPAVVTAVEGRSKRHLKVLDGTAGLGADSFTLAARGHQITAVEQSVSLYWLLTDALQRCQNNNHLALIANRIDLHQSDITDFLTYTTNAYDVIYLDPMFAERQKSAKVKKPMQLLHKLIGASSLDETKLLHLASRHCHKLVIKRAIDNPYFAGKKPTSILKGKSNRFDIYALGNRSK